MKFVKIKNIYKGLNIEYGYCMKLNTITDLLEYISIDKSISNGFADYLDTSMKHIHCKTKMGELISMLHEVSKKDLISTTIDLSNRKYQNMNKVISQGIPIYVFNNNAYTVGTKSIIEVSEIIESNIFPEYTTKDIKTMKFKGGKHWYANIGSISVSINSVNKWSTEKLAYEKACEYLKEKL